MADEKTFTINIESFDEKGAGSSILWRENSQGNKKKLKLTVPYTLPGEKAKVYVDRPEKRRQRAKLLEIIEPHPNRIEPLCGHFGEDRKSTRLNSSHVRISYAVF